MRKEIEIYFIDLWSKLSTISHIHKTITVKNCHFNTTYKKIDKPSDALTSPYLIFSKWGKNCQWSELNFIDQTWYRDFNKKSQFRSTGSRNLFVSFYHNVLNIYSHRFQMDQEFTDRI